jgi:beta-lactam-binding protein with PASTA domain
MSSFVPRLLALTVVWLFATAALTFAAAHKLGAAPAVVPVVKTATVAPRVLVVPDLRRQAFVFSKGTLSDAGFSFRIQGPVQGFASNTVVSQSPAPGTRVIDTGAPLVVLHLARTGSQLGLPEDVSSETPTAVKLAPLPAAVAAQAAAAVLPTKVATLATKVATKAAVAKPTKAPANRLPQQRSPAFIVPGARREPLDEIPLTDRAKALLVWLNRHPNATDANVKHWLYQHAWIVTGAEMGWSHGAEALQTLITADRRVLALWGIGARSTAVARQALAEVEARSK